MKYRKLGKSCISVSSIGFGCMGMSSFYGSTENMDKDAGKKLLQQAYEMGITFFDTAELYGNGANEEILGAAVQSFRDSVVLATKCGIEWDGAQVIINNARDYIKRACEGSLQRLRTDVIDVYYLHRYSPEVALEDSMGTMLELINEGKIRYVGLSEVGPEIIKRAHHILGDKLVAVQSEYSLINRADWEAILPLCKELSLAFVPFAPLARGLLTGKLRDAQSFSNSKEFDFRAMLPQFSQENLENNLRFVDAVGVMAKKLNYSTTQLALAWLLAQGDHVIPIPGTTRLDYLKENIGAVDINLTAEDLEALQDIMNKYSISGARNPEGDF